MKQQSTMTLAVRSSLVLAVAMAFAVTVWSPVQAQHAKPAEAKMKMDGKMMEGCKAMQAQKKTMMENMKVQDADLTEHVAKMNAAPEDTKVDLMAAVITKIVDQRNAMHLQMGKMHEEMMSHMMEHMQMGSDSMAKCPMTMGMKNMSENSTGVHEKHHVE